MESDVIFYIPMIKLADLVSKWMDQVYLFSFEYISQNLTGPDWQGKMNIYTFSFMKTFAPIACPM